MRILLCVHRYPPYIGGSEEVSRRVAEHLAAKGHSVTVATTSHPRRTEDSPRGPSVASFDLATTDLWPQHSGRERQEAVRYREMFAEPWDARFIYAAQSWALNAVWDLIGTGPSADILAPCGYSWLGYPHAQSYFRVIADLLPKFRAVVYHSTEYQDYQFARDRGLHENATVIPNGTTPVKDSGLLDKHDEGRPCVLLTVGSHVRSKGHADFFRVRRQVAHPAALVAPRPATLRERMRGCYYLCRARHSADSGVELIEGSRRETVDAAYRQAGIFFLPSTIETAPLVILEAMASGTPWVSYEVGSVKTLPGGIVVADAADAAREIRSMAADPDRRRRLARAGRNAVEATYSWDRVLPQYEAVVEASARL